MTEEGKAWREFYERSSRQPEWWRAHGWGYSPELAYQTITDIRQKLDIGAHDRVLDVGCASGFVLSALTYQDQSGVGIDYSEALLRRARSFGVDPKRVQLIAGEAAAVPLPDAAFDRVLCYGVFPSFTSTSYATRVVQELVRVCRPGGTVLIGDVPGYVENVRAAWRRFGIGIESARAVLKLPWLLPTRWALLPLRLTKLAVRRLRPSQERVHGQHPDYLLYSHAFFRRLGRRFGCQVMILPQNIPERPPSLYRFDVTLSKPSA